MISIQVSTFLILFTQGLALYAEHHSNTSTISPCIHSDNSVTFNLYMPEADEVILNGSLNSTKSLLRTDLGALNRSEKITMTKKGDFWTYTTPPLKSEFYTYNFIVDGNKLLDPNNPCIVRDITDSLNYFIIKGGVAESYLDKSVPHGQVKKIWYPSALNGMKKRRMTVYLPANYYLDQEKRFPVLYLLHGSGGDEDAWQGCGRAIQILDNLIAQNKCKPMIVVMPNGNVELAAAPGFDPEKPNQKAKSLNLTSMLGQIETVFVDEIVKYIEGNYRTLNNKENRAIAGLSLGGLHTLYISLNNPDKFDYIGLFSAQTTNALNDKRIDSIQLLGDIWNDLKNSLPFIGGGNLDRKITGITSDNLNIYDNFDEKLHIQFKNPPKLYYIAVGKDDFVKKFNDDFRLKLGDNGYRYLYHETDGGHTWENWRKYLIDFLPRIFIENADTVVGNP